MYTTEIAWSVSQENIESPRVVFLPAGLLGLGHTLPTTHSQTCPARPAVRSTDLPQEDRGIVDQEMIAGEGGERRSGLHCENHRLCFLMTHHSDFLAISTAVTIDSTALCNPSYRTYAKQLVKRMAAPATLPLVPKRGYQL